MNFHAYERSWIAVLLPKQSGFCCVYRDRHDNCVVAVSYLALMSGERWACYCSSAGSRGVSEYVSISADLPWSMWTVGDIEGRTAVRLVPQQSLLNSLQTQGSVATLARRRLRSVKPQTAGRQRIRAYVNGWACVFHMWTIDYGGDGISTVKGRVWAAYS